MIQKISALTGIKKWLIGILTVLSFALLKSFDVMALNSVYGTLLSSLFLLANGIFYWLIFEILIGFFYSALKERIAHKISYSNFMNLFRFFVVFLNLFIYIFSKIIILINFYANYLLLFLNLILIFLFLLMMWIIIKKYFLVDEKNLGKVSFWYFGFSFMYLFLHTIMWGVM